MQTETVHVLLIVGQYILVPFAIWAFRRFKDSIVDELKAHVDATMAAHEQGESTKFGELSDRIGRIEVVLMSRGLPPAASARRAGKAKQASV